MFNIFFKRLCFNHACCLYPLCVRTYVCLFPSMTGKVFNGCDVHPPNMLVVPGERSAVLAAIADGAKELICVVIAGDTATDFPIPDGGSREFLRSFGVFKVVLVNCLMELRCFFQLKLFCLCFYLLF